MAIAGIEILRFLAVVACCVNFSAALLVLPLLWLRDRGQHPFILSAMVATGCVLGSSICLMIVAFAAEELQNGPRAHAVAYCGVGFLILFGLDKVALALRLIHSESSESEEMLR